MSCGIIYWECCKMLIMSVKILNLLPEARFLQWNKGIRTDEQQPKKGNRHAVPFLCNHFDAYNVRLVSFVVNPSIMSPILRSLKFLMLIPHSKP